MGGAAAGDALLDCISSNAENGSATAAATGFSGLLAKGSSTGGFAEFVRDELLEPVKSPKSFPPPPNASKTLVLAAAVGAGALKSSNDGAGADVPAGGPNASNGEACCCCCFAAAGAVTSLNGSRDTDDERLPALLVGVGASKASNGVETADVVEAGAGASKPNGSSAFLVGLRPMRSFVAGAEVALVLAVEK